MGLVRDQRMDQRRAGAWVPGVGGVVEHRMFFTFSFITVNSFNYRM
jgi:hypothetical protein